MSKFLEMIRKLLLLFVILLQLENVFGQVTLAGWEMNGLTAYGASPYSPTTTASNLTYVGLTRGSGVTTTPTAAGNAWGGNGLNETTFANALTNNDFITLSITPQSGYSVSLTQISPYNVRRSSSGATSGRWQYQIGSGSFVDIGSDITWGSTTTAAGNAQSAINLSSISALQNVSSGTSITLRLVIWGASGASGTWYFNNFQTGSDLIITGTVNSTSTPEILVSPTSTNFGNSTINTPTSATTYTISGTNLTGAPGNITITPPSTDFEVSNDNVSFGASTTIAYSSATLSSTNFYVRFNPQSGGAKSGNLGFSGGGVSSPPTISVSGTGVTNYYTKSSTSTGLQNTSSWTTDAAGGAGTEPTDFTSNAQIFNIANNATTTISGNWTVSGTGSKIVVASGDFTIPAGFSVTGTIDVNASAELTIENTTQPTLGTLASNSTVQYNNIAVTIPQITFGNLTLSGTGTKTWAGNTTTVSGNLLVDNTTLNAPSGSPFATVALAGNLTYSGTVTNPAATNSFTLNTTGTAAGTQTFTGNGNTIRLFRLASTTANTILASTSGGSTHFLLGNSGGGGLTLIDGSVLNLNGNDLEFFAGGGASLILGTTGSISAGTSTDLIFARAGSSNLGTLRMTSGANTVRSLTVNHSGSSNTILTLGNAIQVNEEVTLTAGSLVSNGNLTLKSTSAASTARINGGTNASITGNVNFERFLPWLSSNNSGFRFMAHSLRSAPVINTISGLPVASNSLIGYNETNNAYEGVNNRTGTWPLATGYGVYTEAVTTLTYAGQPQLDEVGPISLSRNSQRWHYLGNPFPSVLDWDAVSRTDVQNAVWVWEKDNTAPGSGVWGSYVDEVTANNGSRYIAPGQGFIVRANTTGSGSITFPAAARSNAANPSYYRQSNTQGDVLRVRVTKASNQFSIETLIRFRDQATAAFEGNYDAEFMSDFSNNSPDLYTSDAQGVKYSINSLAPLTAQPVLVPLQLETFGAGEYSFTFNSSAMQSGASIQLEDTKTGTFTSINNGSVVNFTAGANDASGRFRLHFNGLATSVAANSMEQVHIYTHEGKVYVRGMETAQALRIVDMTGRVVFQRNQLELSAAGLSPQLAKGTYLVQVVGTAGVKTVKLLF